MVDNQTKRTISNKTQLPDYDPTQKEYSNKSFNKSSIDQNTKINMLQIWLTIKQSEQLVTKHNFQITTPHPESP